MKKQPDGTVSLETANRHMREMDRIRDDQTSQTAEKVHAAVDGALAPSPLDQPKQRGQKALRAGQAAE